MLGLGVTVPTLAMLGLGVTVPTLGMGVTVPTLAMLEINIEINSKISAQSAHSRYSYKPKEYITEG